MNLKSEMKNSFRMRLMPVNPDYMKGIKEKTMVYLLLKGNQRLNGIYKAGMIYLLAAAAVFCNGKYKWKAYKRQVMIPKRHRFCLCRSDDRLSGNLRNVWAIMNKLSRYETVLSGVFHIDLPCSLIGLDPLAWILADMNQNAADTDKSAPYV